MADPFLFFSRPPGPLSRIKIRTELLIFKRPDFIKVSLLESTDFWLCWCYVQTFNKLLHHSQPFLLLPLHCMCLKIWVSQFRQTWVHVRNSVRWLPWSRTVEVRCWHRCGGLSRWACGLSVKEWWVEWPLGVFALTFWFLRSFFGRGRCVWVLERYWSALRSSPSQASTDPLLDCRSPTLPNVAVSPRRAPGFWDRGQRGGTYVLETHAFPCLWSRLLLVSSGQGLKHT